MTKEDFSLKKDVLQIQKKIADLELTATELKEALSKFDTAVLDELNQRVGDVEDLTMVENAAVIELKKMLEGTVTKTEQPQETVPTQLEERLNSLEQKVSGIAVPNVEEIKSSIAASLPVAPTVDTTSFEEKINEIKSGFDSLQTSLNDKVADFEGRVSQMKNTLTYLPDLNTLRADLKNEVLSSMPDYNMIRSDMQSTVEAFKSEFAVEKEKMETALEMVKSQIEKPLPERAVQELEKIRNDWLVNIAKVEAVEKFVENFSNEMNQLKPIIKKLETFEKLMDLQTEITEKLDAFKEYRDHIENAMTKNEDVEKRIQREVSRMKNTEKMFSQIDHSLSILSKEMEKNKREVDEVVRPLEDRIESVSKNVKDFQDVSMSLDKRFDSMEKMISTTQDDMSLLQGNLMSLEQSKLDVTASIANLQETVFKKQPRNELIEVVRKIDSIEAEVQGIKSLKPEDKANELVNKINGLERKIESIAASRVFDEHIAEIVDRLVFLESRLAAMEGMLQDMPRYSPIVVE